MPWAAYPLPPRDAVLERVAEVLDPVLVLLSFAAGQLGSSGPEAQVIYCRGLVDSVDGGCVDLVLDLHESGAGWRIVDVRYGGFPSERWHLAAPVASDLELQLERLAQALPDDLR